MMAFLCRWFPHRFQASRANALKYVCTRCRCTVYALAVRT